MSICGSRDDVAGVVHKQGFVQENQVAQFNISQVVPRSLVIDQYVVAILHRQLYVFLSPPAVILASSKTLYYIGIMITEGIYYRDKDGAYPHPFSSYTKSAKRSCKVARELLISRTQSRKQKLLSAAALCFLPEALRPKSRFSKHDLLLRFICTRRNVISCIALLLLSNFQAASSVFLRPHLVSKSALIVSPRLTLSQLRSICATFI